MNSRILIASGTVAGLAVGAVGGYFLAKKRYEQAFVAALKAAVDEEVAAVEQHYKILTKRGEEYSSPEEVLARRTPQVPEGLDDSEHVVPHTTEELEGILTRMRNWKEGDQEQTLEEAKTFNETLKYWKGDDSRIIGQPSGTALIPDRSRDPRTPYRISEEAFLQSEEDCTQVSLTWYAGDPEPTLADSNDDIPYEPHVTLGRDLTLEDFGEEHVIYFRNPRQQIEYEVNLTEGSYHDLVMGVEEQD